MPCRTEGYDEPRAPTQHEIMQAANKLNQLNKSIDDWSSLKVEALLLKRGMKFDEIKESILEYKNVMKQLALGGSLTLIDDSPADRALHAHMTFTKDFREFWNGLEIRVPNHCPILNETTGGRFAKIIAGLASSSIAFNCRLDTFEFGTLVKFMKQEFERKGQDTSKIVDDVLAYALHMCGTGALTPQVRNVWEHHILINDGPGSYARFCLMLPKRTFIDYEPQ